MRPPDRIGIGGKPFTLNTVQHWMHWTLNLVLYCGLKAVACHTQNLFCISIWLPHSLQELRLNWVRNRHVCMCLIWNRLGYSP